MQDKKEISKKIFELFSKNYSYSQIAKELNISKSIVSNVINYCTPPKSTYEKSIKEIKQDYEKKIKQLKEEFEEEREQIKAKMLRTATMIVFFITLLILNINNYINELLYNKLKLNFVKSLIAMLLITLVISAIFFYITKYLIKEEE